MLPKELDGVVDPMLKVCLPFALIKQQVIFTVR